ncbi:hypothetical protein ASE01_15350 [Nocardioides sp. Root190]|uniref:CoA transferase n=1 Tax=Nocardioides sp. Root190 TaxID=1736488 RepID=UPI0007012BF2|nr:CoA transferase [Nocardioides sp. Root190]KRB76365.1 hypothetical protein ASE01_15350 [Nocardioides sp. Root190]
MTEQAAPAPVYAGLRVVDLTQGVAGSVATMLLADAGAEVVRIDREDDPFRHLPGYAVWHRGKRRTTLDLEDERDLRTLRGLVARADVLVESSEGPGLSLVPGPDHGRLVRCTITPYGDAAAHAGRSAVESLVAARTGLQWEARGVPGTTIGLLSGRTDPLADLPFEAGTGVGPDRPGPMFLGIPWAGLAAGYLATIGVAAALRLREQSGRGQAIGTSLLQGALCAGSIAWQRVEDPDAEGYLGWTTDPRAPKGFYRTSDARWVQQWVQLPSFMLGVSDGDELAVPPGGGVSTRDAELRISTDYQDLVMLQHFHPAMAAAAARFRADDWERVAREAGVPFEVVRSPEEALLDPLLLADGCVQRVDHHELGPILTVGDVVRLSRCPSSPEKAVVAPGHDDAWARAEAEAALDEHRATGPGDAARDDAPQQSLPLADVRVLDLGLAIAGPFGAQVLADLGADVVRVSAVHDGHWMATQYSHMSNRGKRSLVLDLKDPDGLAAFHRLVRSADVVHHNMRASAAERLGVDGASLHAINPRLVHCHTRGYERGPRDGRPANDQTAGALCGTEWVDGAADDGGTPIWPSVSLGDTGNGLLSAIGVLQALHHRDRTGLGQEVDTSIAYAHLLNASSAWTTPDGRRSGDRARIDAQGWGTSALHRIYATADGWLCLAAEGADDRERLVAAVPALADLDPDDSGNDAAVAAVLGGAFAQRDARSWVADLDAHGVPAEVCADHPATALFDDPDLKQRGLVTTFEHPVLGRVEMAGRLIDIDGARPLGRAPLLGEHTAEVLAEAGLSLDEVADLLERGVARETTRRHQEVS